MYKFRQLNIYDKYGKGGEINMAGTSKSRGGSKRGFAAMDEDVQRRIASKGGRASHGSRGSRNRDTGGNNSSSSNS